ncbi:PIN-like domain-containing protein [Nocardia gipuzkoensis]|uniref:PIN-like domain-containing protein n=1 Tax=Nocardia gipuzkoensis TaxID=2749991 RepID=UPI00237DF36F|nr:PIN-like domain-containing protein [Nocardia gipuzkoensis]MDE1675105.1 PIN-like domain-containing protein [Nocardia gipuzkoensis]
MRELFLGYHYPTGEDLRPFIEDGLVALDTNALLDVYRFTEAARMEYIKALELLEDRLWLPHQTLVEFLENRATVLRSKDTTRTEFDANLQKATAEVGKVLAQYAKRCGFTHEQITPLTKRLTDVLDGILDSLHQGIDSAAEVDPDAHPSDDPILGKIEELIDGKIGHAFDVNTKQTLTKMALRRFDARIPPGWADGKKSDAGIGDFLVWEQTMREAKARQKSVLLITNETKADWTRREGELILPRVELVTEMHDRAGQPFHLVDTRAFLELAKRYLAAAVSDATVAEASRLAPDDPSPASIGKITGAVSGDRDTITFRSGHAVDSVRQGVNETARFVAGLDSVRQSVNETARFVAGLDSVRQSVNETARFLAGIENLREG